jgi:hypothetical protein
MKTALPISRAGGAEAEVVVAVARLVPVTVRGAQVPGVVVPGAAAIHAVGAAQGPVPCATVPPPHLDERKWRRSSSGKHWCSGSKGMVRM